MAWEARPGGRYYYHKRRVGGQVVSEYYGTGVIAEITAARLVLAAERRSAERAAAAQAQATRTAEARTPALDTLTQTLTGLTRAVLLVNGYHTHNGTWRHTMPRPKAALPAPSSAIELPSGPWTAEQALDLLQTYLPSEHPPPEVITAVRKLFAEVPFIWKVVGDMAVQAQHRLIERYTSQPLVQEAIDAGIKSLGHELGRKEAPVLEKLLIDQVLTCWINVYDVQQRYANAHAESITLTLGEYWERRLTAAQRRYLRACETLARVRRLAVPPLQVNIGDQQINVAGGSSTSSRSRAE
jgi:hypothetical protein